MNYGVWSLIPIVVVIILALRTKRTLEPLFIGTCLVYVITNGWGCVTAWIEVMFSVLANRQNQWVFMVCALFGSLIALIGAARGTLGFAAWLDRICCGPKTTMLVTWIMGIVIFVDDYLNIMTISTCMKKLTDKNKIPRETISYIIDSTGAPVCALLPFSTWAVFFANLFYSENGVPQLGLGNPLQTFCHVIPYIFYAIAAIILVPLFCYDALPKLGRMKAAYERVRQTGNVYSPESKELNLEEEKEWAAASNMTGNLWDFLIPIGVLTGGAIMMEDLLQAVMAAIAVCFILYIPRGKMTVCKYCDLMMHGFCNMIPTVAIIFFAFFMQQAMTDIGIAEYAIESMEPYMDSSVFPVIVFLTVASLTFSTGSCWGVTAVVSPVMLPMTVSLEADLLLTMGAIVSGAVLGSHACFYSDATVLTSSCCNIQNMDHALSQLPYAIMATVFSAVGYLVCGLAL